jgi:integrase
MKVELTDRLLISVKAKPGQRLEIFDQHRKGAGLMLRVTDSGVKTWMVRYRTLDGRQRRLSLGRYPAMTLAEARDEATLQLAAVGKGKDPQEDRRRVRVEARAQPLKSMKDLSTVYFAACETGEWRPRGKTKRASTLAEERGLWRRHIAPALDDLRVEEVNPAVAKKLLRALVTKGHGVTSNRVRALLRQVMNYAVAESRLDRNPLANVDALGTETARARVISDADLKSLWAAFGDASGLQKPAVGDKPSAPVHVSEAVGIALKLCALTLCRRAEVAEMAVAELDLAQSGWTIPAARTKAGRAQFVPLSDEAMGLVRRAIDLSNVGHEDIADHVFPSPRNRKTPISPGALSHAFRDIRLGLGLADLRVHDLRRTGASVLASERLGVSPFLIGRLLNHSTETGGAATVTLAHYAVHNYAREKRGALTAWATLLTRVVGEGEQPNNVIALGAARA